MDKLSSNEINKKLNINLTTSHNVSINKMSKQDLLNKCKELGFTGCSSKNKTQLLELINSKTNSNNSDDENTIISLTPFTKTLKPLIKWSGGKSDEIKQFEKYFPSEYDTYIEPFIGGGSVYFNLSPKKAIISDVHSELIDFYKCIGEGKSKEIYDFMSNSPNDEETYYKIRDKMKINDKLDSAKRFYYQRKTCFRGMLRYNKDGKFNIPFGKYKTINYNEVVNPDYEDLLKRTEILNASFEHIFETYNSENNFMFLDPPYDSEFTDYGYCHFGKEEQKKLATLFKETKIKCLMVIGKTKFIEELYKDYIVSEYDKKYKFKLYAGRIGSEINTKHLIIKNY
jgi:DNA adenine methylase